MRLVQVGCEVDTATSLLKHTPTHSAAAGGHAGCLVWLSQAGADLNTQVCCHLTIERPSLHSGSGGRFSHREWRKIHVYIVHNLCHCFPKFIFLVLDGEKASFSS